MIRRPGQPSSSAAVEGARAADSRKSLSASRQPMTVLLVEDDAADARLMTEFLSRSRFFEYRITLAACAADALALGRDHAFDVLVLDYWLRGEASLPLRPDWDNVFAAVPTLLVTSVDAADIQSLALDCGARAYLHKNDASPSALDAVIRTMLHVRARAPQLAWPAAASGGAAAAGARQAAGEGTLAALADMHGFARVLSAGTRDIVPGAESAGYMELIRQGSETLIDILRGYLHRSASGASARPDFARTDVGNIVSSVALTTRHRCAEKGHTLLVSTIGGPVLAEVDKAVVFQMLLCLISNAVKFSPRESTITLVLADRKDHCTIAVSDQGIGMSRETVTLALERARAMMASPAVAARLLGGQASHGLGERFGDEPGEALGEGLRERLGLAFVAIVVELHRGTIDIESVEAMGTRVLVTLPVRRARVN